MENVPKNPTMQLHAKDDIALTNFANNISLSHSRNSKVLVVDAKISIFSSTENK